MALGRAVDVLCSRRDDGGQRVVVAEPCTALRLARICADEGSCFLRRAPYTQCFCFELFRHAVVGRDDPSWDALYARYAPLVRHWLGPRTAEDDEEVVVVFGRFWQAVDADKLARFDSLAAVLRYLKVTAYSVRLDRRRTTGAAGHWALPGDAPYRAPSGEDIGIEEMVARRIDASGFWRVVRGLLIGEREGLVLYLSFALGLSPREIQARHAAHFPDVAEVYRIKRNMLDRLRRAPEIRALAGAMS